MIFIGCVFLLVIATTTADFNKNNNNNNNNNCSQQPTCRDCLSHSHLCNWCIQPNNKNTQRCGLESEITSNCRHGDLVKAENTATIIQHKDFSSVEDNIVQLKPQLARISMGKNHTTTISIGFQPADNFPVDLYFVMDTSSTMKKTRHQLANLIQAITKKIGTLTKNYQLGFGSFVDKPIEPFTNTHPDVIKKPCPNCIPAYGFKNHLNLTTNITQFKEMMEGMQTSGNIDMPEGGFDAIVQAVVCKDIIGWRQTSRKILLFFTDGPYHSAGDGKLAGILEANDLHCHLDLQGYYTMSTELDYPSISQLANVLITNKVSLIIGTSHEFLKTYQLLGGHVEGSYVGGFGDDATLENIIYDNYEAIQQSVSLKLSGFDKSAFEIIIRSKCNENQEEETSRCENVKIAKNITFDVSIRAVKCSKGVQRIDISPVGIEESLVVEVEVICECACAQKAITSAECSNKGKLVCGVCECDSGFYGERCACEGSGNDEYFYCRSQASNLVCSGRGECVCGRCECWQEQGDRLQAVQYQGDFCQCSNDTCRYEAGSVCSGRGVCECGACKCEIGFKGDSCECSLDITNCTSSNGAICNDKGACECGKCVCNRDVSYKGPTCEDCPTCLGKCQSLVNCVSCRLDNYHQCSKQCGGHDYDAVVAGGGGDDDDATDRAFQLVEELPEANPSRDEVMCVQRDGSGCVVSFIYRANMKGILALKHKECPAKPNLFLIIGTTIGGVLLMGVVSLVVWKVVVTFYDRNEYLAFEKEGKATKWGVDDNPLYRNAVSNFQNPTFKSKLF